MVRLEIIIIFKASEVWSCGAPPAPCVNEPVGTTPPAHF